jgi:hypothetical protein
MPKRRPSSLKRSLQQAQIPPLAWVLLAGLLFVLVSALVDGIPQFFFGEEFFLFHYANNFDHLTAWFRYFVENGRLVETLYWTYLYKLVGYNPLLIHALAFVLLLAAAGLAAKCFLNIWPEKDRPLTLPYLFVFLLFFNWISHPLTYKVSSDNGRLSLIFFFCAGLVLQRWAARQELKWLLLSLGFFLLSIFSYENTVLLFPALLLLAWPLVDLPKAKRRAAAVRFAWLAALSGGLAALPYLLYKLISLLRGGLAHPALVAGSPLDFVQRVLRDSPSFILQIGNSGQFAALAPGGLLTSAVVITLLLSILAVAGLLSRRRQPTAGDTPRFVFAFAAAGWIFLFGFLPYVAIGYGPTGRSYSSAVFGLFPLLLLAFHYWKQPALRALLAISMLIFMTFGFFESSNRLSQILSTEAADNQLYRGLKQAVPGIQPATVFIFIDRPLSNSGCGPSLEILYGQDNLACAFFSSTDNEYRATRQAELIEANRGGFLRDENWILIAVDESGTPYVVDELLPGDFDLFITWEVDAPIRTDFSRIQASAPPSQFYENLLVRQRQLGLP